MSDLETLIPQAVELVIDGEPLAIKPLKVGQMPAFLRAITPVMQQIGGDGIDWLALFGERGDDLLTAVSIAVGKPRAWVDELAADEAILLAAKVLVELYRVAFDPLKEISFISDEYNKFELEGSLLADTTKPYDAVLGQFGRIVQL